MDILDVCDPTPEGHRYILLMADYFSKWTEAFPMKNKCADTVANILVEHIKLRFGMPMVIHSDQGREFENGLMKSLCTLLGCTKTRTAPYHPEWDGMIERFNRTCLMMVSMFVNDASPHPFATWVRDALEVAYDHVRESLNKTAARRKRLYDTKAVNRKFPVGSWVLRYYPPV